MPKSRSLVPSYARYGATESYLPTFLQFRQGMSLRGQLVFAVMALLLAASCFAQGPARHADVIFQNLDRDNGLPSPIVQGLAQDDHGFIWVGTGSGVSRWDGYYFRNYGVEVGVPGSLPDNDIYSMYTDPMGTLWVGTVSRGVARYDSAHDRFQTFVPPGKDKTYVTVYAMMTDGAHGLLIGTREGLSDLDPGTGKFTPVELQGAQGRVRVLTMVRDHAGRIWAGTAQGIFRSDSNGRHFTHLDVFAKQKIMVWRLFFDHEGRLWIGSVTGAFVLEPSEQTARPIHDTGPGPSLLDQEAVDTICEAAPGVIWLGTLGQGIVAVDAKTLETHRIVHDPGYPTSLPSDSVVKLLTDDEGSVWVGTTKGVSRAELGRGILTFYGATGLPNQEGRLADPDITAILPADQGRLWLGLNEKGVELVTLNGTAITPVRQIPAGIKALLPAGQVNALVPAQDGSIYMGTANWVYRVDREGRNLAALPRPPGASGVHVDALYYNAGALWIGSHMGLWKQEVPNGSAPRSQPQPIALPLQSPEITVLWHGKGNDLWIATSAELVRYDMATHAIERISVNPDDPNALPAQATSLLLDREQRLWATTWGGGVCIFEGRDANGKPRIRRISQGLPNTNADDLLEAPDGKIWVSTDDGFAIIDPRSFAVTPLHQADGVAIPAYWVKSGSNTADGRLLFGGDGGLTVVNPAQFKPLSYVAPVAVTDVETGGKPAPFDLYNQDAQDAGNPVLQIPHDADSVAVEFASLDYTGSDLALYAYKLDGFDRDWITVPSTRRVASYTNLPPGKYTLELRASNRDGVWGKVRRVQIRVMPAWYQTLWAKTAAFLLLLLILFTAFQVSTAYMRARQRELERRVELRTAELKKTTEELEESRRQLEQMAHSDALTGLPNRRMFSEHLRQLLATSRRHEKRPFTLILFDLDKFKEINDAFGHDAGDACLKMVALRVKSIVRESDCFARLGGDEFALLTADPMDEAGIATLCRALAACMTDSLQINDSVLNTTFSIGVSTYPLDGEDEAALVKAADVALYRVKRAGGNGWLRYIAAAESVSDLKNTAVL